MTVIGIDKIAFSVPDFFLSMDELAAARGIEPAKLHIGIGQDEMAVSPVYEDIITYASRAASHILDEADKQAIDMVIIGTESSVDESKAASVVVHGLLDIQPFARSVEFKEACYGATAGIALAKAHIAENPERKVLVIASDIAKYGLKSAGEPTQGAGAVAMLIAAEPRILALKSDNVALTQDIYDFWRPTGQEYPSVDGKFSNETYIGAFAKVWQEYKRRTGLDFRDFAALAFHTPYTKMGKKAVLPELEGSGEEERLLARYEEGIVYNRRVGNLYTGSLYLSLISLLEQSEALKGGDKIGLFSYGSGTVAEFFSGELVPGFEEQLRKAEHEELLNRRKALSIEEYEKMFSEKLEAQQKFEQVGVFGLCEINDNIRHYYK